MTTPDPLERITRLEERLAALEQGTVPPPPDEVPFYPTSFNGLAWIDATSFTTAWETLITPRTLTLALGLVLIGDSVGGVNTGGEWRVVLNDTGIVRSGTVPASFSWVFPAEVIDLSAHLTSTSLKIQIQARRTAGAATGGRYGNGGAVGCSPRYARLL
ncbi:hypothetical protein ACFSJS_22515 [Streptomyces desertarenae]|uniref:Uncharacterized protein n=1 Tax=Streptomyces desertarenae TaxID=2666184 RepID=A0ABW4PQ63_9ACTN